MTKVRGKAKSINLELVEQISNEHYANLSGKHENSRDQSVRHDGSNDASALLPTYHPPEVGQEGASIVYSTVGYCRFDAKITPYSLSASCINSSYILGAWVLQIIIIMIIIKHYIIPHFLTT